MTSIRSSSQILAEGRHAISGVVFCVLMSCDEEFLVRLKSEPGMRFK